MPKQRSDEPKAPHQRKTPGKFVPISFNWQTLDIKPQQITDNIHGLMLDIDEHGEAVTQDADCKTKFAVELRMVDENLQLTDNNGTVLMRKCKGTTKKKLSTKTGKTYFARFHIVSALALERVALGQSEMLRMSKYKWSSLHLTIDMGQQMLNDLALTLELHPAALGCRSDSGGRVYMPRTRNLIIWVCTEIFLFLESTSGSTNPGGIEEIKLPARKWSPIPSLTHSLKVTTVNKNLYLSLRAVLVLEHRNVEASINRGADDIESIVGGQRLENIVGVTTHGFADLPTREFLHLLSIDPAFEGVPFLWISDHDPRGFRIFLALKYGSLSSAWASPFATCSQLQWVGPTHDDLRECIRDEAQASAEEHRKEDWTDEMVDLEATRMAETNMGTLETYLASTVCQLDTTDITELRSFQNHGYLRMEEKLQRQVDYMLEHGCGVPVLPDRDGADDSFKKFRLSTLARYCTNGMENTIFRYIAVAAAEVKIAKMVRPQPSQTRAAFDAQNSSLQTEAQLHSQPQLFSQGPITSPLSRPASSARRLLSEGQETCRRTIGL